ncbi:MAG: UDP-N-acetylmuramate dehydrogenase [Ferrimonas sp.]
MSLVISYGQDLTSWCSFGISCSAQAAITITSVSELSQLLKISEIAKLPKVILGSGSNVLFTEAFDGLIIRNQIQGRVLHEDDNGHYVHLGGGEEWPSIVRWTLDQGIPGLENLALIPGTAGAAPIQNIGAYGADFAEFCQYVDWFDFESGQVERMTAQICQFGYRDSIFKKQLRGRGMVVAVGLFLPKHWQPKISYGPLQQLTAPDPEMIYKTVVYTRQSKLPDPTRLGNAGSFFKNPVISFECFSELQARYPSVPGYADPAGMKLAAGWLIEQCQLKGKTIGGAQVHQQQALVLVNLGNATAQDVLKLAQYVVAQVHSKFGVLLEPEVRLLNSEGQSIW